MKEENKKSKKKILLYYLILAACLLVIAAVTVTVIFTVNRNQLNNPSIDGPGINQGDDNDPGNSGDNDNQGGDNAPGNSDDNNPGGEDPDDKPTGSDTSFGLPVNSANVTTRYVFAYDVTLDNYRVHQGMDFEAEAGTQVCAVLDGTVSQIVTDHKLGENYVTLTHANGVTTTYKYINASDNLVVGNTVKRGDVIGTIAEASGMEMNQGEHLHFEIKVNGKTADPETYLDIAEK